MKPSLLAAAICIPILSAEGGIAQTSNFINGNGGNTNFIPTGEILPNGALSARAGSEGCQDMGTGLSVIVGNGVTSGAGLAASVAQSGIVGGCTKGTTTPASYGSFDSAAEFIQNYHTQAVLAITGPAYTPTTVTLPTPLTAAQTAMLYKWMYILTNSVDSSNRQYGAYLTGWSVNGSGLATSLTVAGFMPLGAGSGTAASTPSSTYKAGTGSSPVVYIGEPTNLFTRNEVCSLEMDTNVGASVCTEVDAVNNSGADSTNLNGYRFEAMGKYHPGTALYVNSVSGDIDSWTMGLDIEGYNTNGGTGVRIVQPVNGTVGNNVGLEIITGGKAGAVPVIIEGNGSSSIFTVDGDGNLVMAGALNAAGFIGTSFNSASVVPTTATNGNAVIGSNYTGGGGEVDFWNTGISDLIDFRGHSGTLLAEVGPLGVSTANIISAGQGLRACRKICV
jgi:hypothetical protein